MKRHSLQKWPLGIDSVYSLMRAGATCLGQGTPFFAEGLGSYARAALSSRLSKVRLTSHMHIMRNHIFHHGNTKVCARMFAEKFSFSG